jgi:hypothetical protein
MRYTVATPYQLNAALLKRGIEHVCYEYANLISAAHWSINGQPSWRTNVDDAFLLGYRKLRDFLLKDKRSDHKGMEPPDILASHYSLPGLPRTWTLPTWELEWQAEMDKQLAHIRFEREKEWNHIRWVPTLESEMRTAWAAFLASADPQRRSEFAARLARCQGKPGFSAVRP